MQHPHRRWEGCRGDPWGSGLPDPARARGQAPADTAANGEQALQPLRSEPRVTWRTLDGRTAKAHRSMAGRWRQRLQASWTRRPGQRTAWATSAGPAPPHEGGDGMRGPPLPHAATGGVQVRREGLTDARRMGTACAEESESGRAHPPAQEPRGSPTAGEGGARPGDRKRGSGPTGEPENTARVPSGCASSKGWRVQRELVPPRQESGTLELGWQGGGKPNL